MKHLLAALSFFLALVGTQAFADANYDRALKRAQYLLDASVPTDADFGTKASSDDAYKAAVRSFIDGPNFYETSMRYHERLFGTGLNADYLDELKNDDIDNKANKFAQISCNHDPAANSRPQNHAEYRVVAGPCPRWQTTHPNWSSLCGIPG